MIEEAKENAPQLLRYFLETYDILVFKETGEPSPHASIDNSNADSLVKSCQNLIRELISSAAKKNLPENEFYELIWKSISDMPILNSADEKGCALFCVCNSPLIPYFQLNDGLKMENSEFREITQKIGTELHKMQYILAQSYDQRTEEASLLLGILESLSNKKDKTVFIAQLIISLKLLGAPEFLMDVIKKQVDEKE